MVKIKFCGLVRKDDLMVACRLGVDFVGLVLYARSPRALQLNDAWELRRTLPSSVQCVGLFVNAHPEHVHAVHKRLGLDLIQFHGDESPERCLLSSPLPFWRAVRMQHAASLDQAILDFDLQAGHRVEVHKKVSCEAFLVDAHAKSAYGGTGHAFDWSWLESSKYRPERLVLGGGLGPDNVKQAIQQLKPWAVDVSSGIQGASPRVKDAGKMEAFVDAVRSANCDNFYQKAH